MSLVSVIILNYHSEADLVEAVKSLEESTVPKDFERKVFVVDNDSSMESWEAIQDLKKYPDLELIRSEKNLGFTGGNNLAIKKTSADFYLLLNPDTKVAKDFLVELIKPFIETVQYRHLTKERQIGLASPKIYFYPGFEFHKDRYSEKEQGKVIWYAGGEIDWQNVVGKHKHVDEVDDNSAPIAKLSLYSGNFAATDFCTGCCMLISNEVIDKIGMLDDKLFFSMEDVDYCMKARAGGFEAIYVPDSVIWHKNGNTSGGAGSKTQDFYQIRNRLIFAFRYTPLKTKLLLLWLLVRTSDANRLRAILSAFKVII